MTQTSSALSLAQLLTELQNYSEQGETGRLVVSSSNNLFISFGFSKGDIVSIICGNKNGETALEMIASVDASSVTFTIMAFMKMEKYSGDPTGQLISNEAVFKKLGGVNKPQSTKPATPDSTAANSADREALQSMSEPLQELLANYVGPIAPILCRDAIASSHSAARAIESLAERIPDSSSKQEFLDRAYRLLMN